MIERKLPEIMHLLATLAVAVLLDGSAVLLVVAWAPPARGASRSPSVFAKGMLPEVLGFHC